MLKTHKPHKSASTLKPNAKPTRLKSFWNRMKALEEAFDYDPVEDLIKSKTDMDKQIALLEARVLDLEKPNI